MDKKLKVVWLCYFTNNDVQDIIKPHHRVGEKAPWISNLIPLFENRDDIELHIISQHEWLYSDQHFEKNGIHYNFINYGIPFSGRPWPSFFRPDLITGNKKLNDKIAKIVHQIQPDIIHLHGAENEFCSAIFQFQEKYPVFITIQGFIHKTSTQGKSIRYRIHNELNIMKHFRHFGYRSETMGKQILELNPKAQLHWHRYRIPVIKPFPSEKIYDLVFFAKLSKEKGIEDVLKCIALIKQTKPDISLCIIGGGKTDFLKDMAHQLGISENLHWKGFLPTQDVVHREASKARISVLPTYNDIISGTIIESMFLGLPVVAYNTGSIHEINAENEIITLIEKEDIPSMAEAIISLLSNEPKLKEISEKGIEKAHKKFRIDDDEVRNGIMNAYYSIITNKTTNTEQQTQNTEQQTQNTKHENKL